MAPFDSLVQEIGERYCLGPNASPLIEEARRYISRQPGGVRAFIDKCKAAGFSLEVASWLKGSEPVPLSGEEIEQTLGPDAVDRIAAKLGVSRCFARTVLGYAIPNVVALRAQGGAIPAAIRGSASRLMRAVLGESATPGKEPKHTLKTRWADAEPVLGGLIIPCVTMLMILGSLLGYFIGAGDRDVTQPPQVAAQKTEPAAPQPATASGKPLPSGKSYAFAPVAGSGWALLGASFQPLSGQNASNQADVQKLSEPEFRVIFFAPSRAAANPATKPLLPRIAQLIKQLPKGTVVEIAGYTDSTGRPTANMKLSQRRANAIRGALVRAGADPRALVAKGNGVFHTAPQASENGAVEGRSTSHAANGLPNGRRVEFRISQDVSSPASASQ